MSDESGPRAEGYALSESDKGVLRDLASTLAVTGLVLMALAIVAILYAVVFIVSERHDPTLLVVTALCAPLVVAGFWLRSAAEPLTRIVDAPGEAAPRLISVMREFLRVFTLQRTGFALALVVAVAGVLLQALR
ncbi:MAG: hypothetical protein U0325_12570 [Polyangiales bacterium]